MTVTPAKHIAAYIPHPQRHGSITRSDKAEAAFGVELCPPVPIWRCASANLPDPLLSERLQIFSVSLKCFPKSDNRLLGLETQKKQKTRAVNRVK